MFLFMSRKDFLIFESSVLYFPFSLLFCYYPFCHVNNLIWLEKREFLFFSSLNVKSNDIINLENKTVVFNEERYRFTCSFEFCIT